MKNIALTPTQIGVIQYHVDFNRRNNLPMDGLLSAINDQGKYYAWWGMEEAYERRRVEIAEREKVHLLYEDIDISEVTAITS